MHAKGNPQGLHTVRQQQQQQCGTDICSWVSSKHMSYRQPTLSHWPADEITNQNEVLTIAAISSDGLTLTTQEKIQFSHYG